MPSRSAARQTHIVLELGDLAVGEHHLPHHLDDAEPALLVDLAHDDAGEMIEIDRLALDQRGRGDQLVGGAGIELEAGFDQAVQLALLDRGGLAVERDDVDQQRGRREPVVGLVEGALLGSGETMSAMNWRSLSSIRMSLSKCD